jgi:hypothetical protein
MRRQVRTHDLQCVVQQQTERQLEQDRFRHRADQVPQREHVGDLVENRLDPPPALIGPQHRLGWILHLVQQVRDHAEFFVTGPVLRDPPHVLPARLLDLAQPAPLLHDPMPLGVAALLRRPSRIGDERRIATVADQEMASGFQHLLREVQVAVKSVQHHQPQPFAGRPRQLQQQHLGESRFTRFAIEIADHRHRQTRPQVQAHRRPRPQDARLQTTQRLEQPFDMLDRLAIGAEDFVIGPAARQRVHSRVFRQDRVHPLSAFLKQGLAHRDGQVPQLRVGRGDRDRQDLHFLCPLEGLLATAAVFQQGIGDQMGEGAELQVLLVAAPPVSRPEILEPGIVHRKVQQSPHRVGQGKLLHHRGGKHVVVHDRRTPGETQGDARWVIMISASYSPRNAKTLNSLAT